MKRVWLLMAIVALAGTWGCEADESAPHRSTRDGHNLLTPGEKEKDNAEHRVLEKPQRDLPGGGGSEFPGQSAAPAKGPAVAAAAGRQSIQTLDQAAFAPDPACCKAPPPTHQPLAVPGTGMTIGTDWGTLPAMASYPHRAWPDQHVNYQSSDTKHNPLYFTDLTNRMAGDPYGNYERGKAPACPVVQAVDIPWFYGNLVAWPFLLAIDCPFAQRTTSVHWQQPAFTGHLPQGGEIAPTPVPGTIHWEYAPPKVYQSGAPATQP